MQYGRWRLLSVLCSLVWTLGCGGETPSSTAPAGFDTPAAPADTVVEDTAVEDVTDPCAGAPLAGCCAGDVACSAVGGASVAKACGAAGCGWDGALGIIRCGGADVPPPGVPLSCGCAPACAGKECGPDGCGGACGACPGGIACAADGTCGGPCVASCAGKACGPDGCGSLCGACAAGTSCDASGQCACASDCAGKACGPDGCGGTCGDCVSGSCEAGQCKCVPDCAGKACGPDGCGGSCGGCVAGTCEAGQCACTPSCGGKACGPDGCGSLCGTCPESGACIDGACAGPCTPSCAGKACGPDGCGSLCGMCGGELACDATGQCACPPKCVGKACGADGCGGTCGACAAGTTCSASGQCDCVPACTGKACGPDGCGEECGSCQDGTVCDANGQCVCIPDCQGKECGPDGCGGECGACPEPKTCGAEGLCGCIPDCDGKACGPDGCGALCGVCPENIGCDEDGQCGETCIPSCPGKACGPDGCGSLCGQCAGTTMCEQATGQCVCAPSCAGKQCGTDGCGGDCGTCSGATTCVPGGQCVCTPSCAGKACGSDGCGGICGSCLPNAACTADGVCACVPACAGKQCGSDGCGGTCGTCGPGNACSAEGQCVCAPACAGKECGADGCGGSCGACVYGVCSALGACECTPQCAGKACGADGCGGSCGACEYGMCSALGTCECAPKCEGLQCGADGCGGSCGTCEFGTCDAAGQCLCTPDCAGKACGANGCGGTCGTCAGADICTPSGSCVCLPNCKGKTCGSDGCGGSCGTCAASEACDAAGKCQCIPQCAGKACGSNGCGGTCGACASGEVCDQAGKCACNSGAPCTPVASPCVTGTTSCSGGTTTCTASTTPLVDGASCGVDKVCAAGKCVTCVAGLDCAPDDECSVGKTTCTSGVQTCKTTAPDPAMEGKICGFSGSAVCIAGRCTCPAGEAYVLGECNVCSPWVYSTNTWFPGATYAVYVNSDPAVGLDNACCGRKSTKDSIAGACRTLTQALANIRDEPNGDAAKWLVTVTAGNASSAEQYPLVVAGNVSVVGAGASTCFPGTMGLPIFEMTGSGRIERVRIGATCQGAVSGASIGIRVDIPPPSPSATVGGVDISGTATGVQIERGGVDMHYVYADSSTHVNTSVTSFSSRLGTGIRCAPAAGQTASVRLNYFESSSALVGVFAGSGCTVKLRKSVSIGSCTTRSVVRGIVAEGSAKLVSELEVTTAFHKSSIGCTLSDAITLRPSLVNPALVPSVELGGLVVTHAGCSGVRVEGGTGYISASTIAMNHTGVTVESAQSGELGLSFSGTGTAPKGPSSIYCNGSKEPGFCCQPGNCPPGFDFFNRSGLAVNAEANKWEQSPVIQYKCDESLGGCKCAGAPECVVEEPPDGTSVVNAPLLAGQSPTTSLVGNSAISPAPACTYSKCTPNCTGRECGSDGCGGTCGACGAGESCADAGVCCAPNCGGKTCGSDGCGGTCGSCAVGTACEGGICACMPQCTGKTCGSDGCGGTCGSCANGEACLSDGVCGCPAACLATACGTDGCNGVCGLCPDGQTCSLVGQCACIPSCAGKACGADGCGGSCGICPAGPTCGGPAKGELTCTPYCTGKECGADGCGGSCGTCPSTSPCNSAGKCTCSTGSTCYSPDFPCNYGGWSCSANTCNAQAYGYLKTGTPCGDGKVCNGSGKCVACIEGLPCAIGLECRTGVTSCATSVSKCVDAGADLAKDGTTCAGTGDGVCVRGECTCPAGTGYVDGKCQTCPPFDSVSKVAYVSYPSAVFAHDDACCGRKATAGGGVGAPCATIGRAIANMPAGSTTIDMFVGFGDNSTSVTSPGAERFPIRIARPLTIRRTAKWASVTILGDPDVPMFVIDGASPVSLVGLSLYAKDPAHPPSVTVDVRRGPGGSEPRVFLQGVNMRDAQIGLRVSAGVVDIGPSPDDGWKVSYSAPDISGTSRGIACVADTGTASLNIFSTTYVTAPRSLALYAGNGCRIRVNSTVFVGKEKATANAKFMDYGLWLDGDAQLISLAGTVEVNGSTYNGITLTSCVEHPTELPELVLRKSTIHWNGCAGLDVRAGLASLVASTVNDNHWGVIQGGSQTLPAIVRLRGVDPFIGATTAADSIGKNGTKVAGECCSAEGCLPGFDVWNRSGLLLWANDNQWEASPVVHYTCDSKLQSCTCTNTVNCQAAPPDGTDVVNSPSKPGQSPTTTTVGSKVAPPGTFK